MELLSPDIGITSEEGNKLIHVDPPALDAHKNNSNNYLHPEARSWHDVRKNNTEKLVNDHAID